MKPGRLQKVQNFLQNPGDVPQKPVESERMSAAPSGLCGSLGPKEQGNWAFLSAHCSHLEDAGEPLPHLI